MPEFLSDALSGAAQLAHNLRGTLQVLRMAIDVEVGGLDPEQRSGMAVVIADAVDLAIDLSREIDCLQGRPRKTST